MIYANPAASRFLGLDPAALPSEPIHVPFRPGESSEITLPRQGGESLALDVQMQETSWQEKPARMLILRDVTSQQVTAKALHRREATLRALLEQSPDGIVMTDEGGKVTFWNQGQTHLSGLDSEQVSGTPLWEALLAMNPPSWRREGYQEELRQTILRIITEGKVSRLVERRLVKPDGSQRAIQYRVFPVKTDQGTFLGSIARDIHEQAEERDLRERKLQAVEQQLAAQEQALEREMAERQRQQAELEAITNLTNSLRNTKSQVRMAEALLSGAGTWMEAEAAALMVWEEKTEELRVLRASGDWEPLTGLILSPTEGATGTAFKKRQLYVNNQVYFGGEDLPEGPFGSFKAVLAAPLYNNGDTYGVLWMGRSAPWGVEEVERMTTIASLATSAVHCSRLNEQGEKRVNHLAALHKIDQVIAASLDLPQVLSVLLEQVTTMLGVDAAGVSLYSPATQTLDIVARRGFHTGFLRAVRLQLGEGGAGRAALERRIVHISDMQVASRSSKHTDLLALEGFRTYYAVPLIAQGQVKGVLEMFHRDRMDPDTEWLEFLETLAGQAAIVIDHAELFEEVQQSNIDLQLAYDNTLWGWASALELRDQETKGHAVRVTNLTVEMALQMGYSEDDLQHIKRGAILHDVGKMGIPDSILLKPGPLTASEWEIMRMHPIYAIEMLETIKFLKPALEIPYYHHEKWDGTGYPRGLKGEQIPLPARIFAVADVYDALTHERPYHDAWSKESALRFIGEQKGRHFDPPVVDVFMEYIAQAM